MPIFWEYKGCLSWELAKSKSMEAACCNVRGEVLRVMLAQAESLEWVYHLEKLKKYMESNFVDEQSLFANSLELKRENVSPLVLNCIRFENKVTGVYICFYSPWNIHFYDTTTKCYLLYIYICRESRVMSGQALECFWAMKSENILWYRLAKRASAYVDRFFGKSE